MKKGVAVKSLIFFAFLFSVFFPLTAGADQYHYKNMLIGERPAGMAGAYNGVSDTPEGAFYNPAGMAYAVGQSLSVSVNAFNYARTQYEGVLGGGDWTRSSSSLAPNFFGMIQPWGKGKIAFSYAVPDTIEEDQNQRYNAFGNVSSLTINISNIDKTYKFGPSYAQKINDTLSIGATLYVHYRQIKLISNQYYRTVLHQYEWVNENTRQTEYGIEPKLGIMWSPEKFSIGLTVSQNTIIDSSGRYQKTYKTDIPSGTANNTLIPDVYTFDDKRKYPLSISLGGAWFSSESLMVSCDIDYYSKVSSESRDAVVNVAVGAEYYLSEKYALRGGFYTNRANTPEIDSGDTNSLDHVDLYGVTASISRFTRASAMTLGINYAYGEGEAQPVSGTTIYDATMNTMTVFLSGSFSY